MTRTEWRVSWRRPDWKHSSWARRYYQLEVPACRFAQALRGSGEFEAVDVTWRTVGQWCGTEADA